MRSKPPSPKTSDAKLIDLFLDMLAAEQGAGDNTLDAYRRDLTDFSEFLGSTGQGFTGTETQALRDYLADLDARGFKSSSVARRLSAMRHLFRFLLNERIQATTRRPSFPALSAAVACPKCCRYRTSIACSCTRKR